MRIAAYCRVSTEKEAQLDSLEKQKEYFDEFAKKNNHKLVKIYADEGISGKQIKKRDQFIRMMSDAELGLFDMVVVKDISRFSRNTVDFLESIRKLKSLNIEVVFTTNNQTVLGNSEFVLTIFSALAQEESAGLSKRIKFGKSVTAKNGRVPNSVYGYDKGEDRYTLIVNEEESKVVKRMFDMYVFQGLGTTKIAQQFNREGIPSKRGKSWTQVAVSRMLINELYVGKIHNRKSEIKDFITGERREFEPSEWLTVDKPELRLVEQDVFDKAGRMLTERTEAFQNGKERHSAEYALSTLIRCACCGYAFRRISRQFQYGEYAKWTCSTRNSKGSEACPNAVFLDEEELMAQLRSYVQKTVANREKFLELCKREFNRLYQPKEQNEQTKESLSAELKKLKTQKDKFMQMYLMDVINAEELKEKTTELNARMNEVQGRLEIAESNLTKSEVVERQLPELLQNMDRLVNCENLTNADMKAIFEKILVYPDGKVEIYLKSYVDLGLTDRVLVRIDRT